MIDLVIDTDVLVAAVNGPGGAAREVIRRCIRGDYRPLIGAALFAEYEDVMARTAPWRNARLSHDERRDVFAAFARSALWCPIYFRWRPNLPDEADNHLVELAVAGAAAAIVTRNVRHLRRAELRFDALRVLTPVKALEAFPCQP